MFEKFEKWNCTLQLRAVGRRALCRPFAKKARCATLDLEEVSATQSLPPVQQIPSLLPTPTKDAFARQQLLSVKRDKDATRKERSAPLLQNVQRQRVGQRWQLLIQLKRALKLNQWMAGTI